MPLQERIQEASQRFTELQLLKPRVVAALGFDPTAVRGWAVPHPCLLLAAQPLLFQTLNCIRCHSLCCRSPTIRSSYTRQPQHKACRSGRTLR